MKDDPTAWMDQAPCVNDSRFLAVDNPVNIQDAQTICLTRCPVYTECRAFRDSDPNGDLHAFEGIWAGDVYDPAGIKRARERDRIARKRNGGGTCGTDAGWYSHRSRRDEPCEPCETAHKETRLAKSIAKAKARGAVEPVIRDDCGTTKGHHHHRDNNEWPCVPCREANSAYKSEWRKRDVA